MAIPVGHFTWVKGLRYERHICSFCPSVSVSAFRQDDKTNYVCAEHQQEKLSQPPVPRRRWGKNAYPPKGKRGHLLTEQEKRERIAERNKRACEESKSTYSRKELFSAKPTEINVGVGYAGKSGFAGNRKRGFGI